jgi:hypothetical protein
MVFITLPAAIGIDRLGRRGRYPPMAAKFFTIIDTGRSYIA